MTSNITATKILETIQQAPNQQMDTKQLLIALGVDGSNISEIQLVDRLLRMLIDQGKVMTNFKNDTGFIFGTGGNGYSINLRIFTVIA